MKKIIITLALCSAMLGMASCTRGGNIDRGDDGYLGYHKHRHEDKTDAHDTDKDERNYDDGIGDDIYNLPRDIRRDADDAGNDIRRGLNDVGDDVHNGLKNAEYNIRHGLNRGGDIRDGVRDNNMIK